MKTKKRLTEAEFSQVKALFPKMKARNMEAAYACMVDGRIQRVVAKEIGITDKAMCQIIGRIWIKFQAEVQRPAGWQIITVCLPPDQVNQVRQMEEEARKLIKK
ncbi:TrfB-related DNA-binding protein [Chromobacterium piscinae]|uniref:TrfB-related DNA-binding protein n=1 Tax=Chromobacterium piscinae TaxID=686831 RepID=UPI001E4D2DBE|nr:transcriptional regulator KorA [Chromobacterium piscinae]